MCGHVGEGIPLVEAPEDSKFQIVFPVVIGNENLSLILAAGWMSQPLEPTRLQAASIIESLSHSVLWFCSLPWKTCGATDVDINARCSFWWG